MNLRHIVCGSTHVVLDEAAPFKESNLGEIVTHMHAHEISPERPPITLFAASPSD
jgi:hypothetical protein